MRKILISALIAGAALAATPAAAQHRGYQAHGDQISQQINQLSHQIVRAQQRQAISPREANGLRRQVTTLQRNLRLYGRNGLDRREIAVLQSQINQVRHGLRAERRDNDRRRG